MGTPEVRLEVVRNGPPPFSTNPRSALVSGKNGDVTNPPVARGLPCDTPKMRNPEKWSSPRSLLQVPENPELGKTGRGPEDDREMSQRHLAVPEDDLKPYCKIAESAKLQCPERLTRG